MEGSWSVLEVLNWTEYCICDLMLPIAAKGKADIVLIETEDRTLLGL
jgi:hypothetical protein